MINFGGECSAVPFLMIELINHIYVFFEVKFACRVDIGEASVNTLQIVLYFHEIFVTQMYSIHDIIHIIIMS